MAREPTRYTNEELIGIYRSLAGHASLFVPVAAPAPEVREVGPAFQVRIKYSEVHPDQPAEEAYWDLLQRIPFGGIGILSSIINLLVSESVLEQNVHRFLEDRFATPDLRDFVRNRVREDRAFSVLFG